MQARHRRNATDDTCPANNDQQFALLIDDSNSIDISEEKKYNKKWTFTKYSTDNLPTFIGALGSKISGGISSYIPVQSISLATTNLHNNIINQQQQQHQLPQSNGKSGAASLTTSNSNSDFQDDLLSDTNPIEEIEVMTARDRTLEFSNAIRSLQGPNIARAVNVRDPRKVKQLQSYSEFMMIAKHIGKNIANTYSKLEKLTLLAKRKSLFDDRPAEIQELTYIIKGDLNSLNQQIARLQEISKSQRKTTNGKHLLSHSSNMVIALQSKLANMSSDFKQILEVRTENLKQQKSRRDQFSQGQVSNSLPPSATRGGPNQSSLLLAEQDQVSIDFSENQPLVARNQIQQQQYLMYDESDNYVQQRAETMQNIESTIVELGGIFSQLAHMVKEQEEMVERIDTNIQDTELNIEAAHTEILKYFQSVTKNRWLMIKIFGVLLVFFIFFVVFLT